MHQNLNSFDVDLLRRLLSSNDSGARIAATQVLRFWQDEIDGSLDLIRQQIDDSDMRVRLQAVLASSFSKSEKALETALEAANYEMDLGLEHALNETLRPRAAHHHACVGLRRSAFEWSLTASSWRPKAALILPRWCQPLAWSSLISSAFVMSPSAPSQSFSREYAWLRWSQATHWSGRASMALE